MTQPPCTIQIERAYSAEDAAVVQAGLRAYIHDAEKTPRNRCGAYL